MTDRVLFVAREFTAGGAAYLALRHLQHLANDSRRIDLVVTGPVTTALAEQLPARVTLHQFQINKQAFARGILGIREAIAAAGEPWLGSSYDTVIGSSLFPGPLACTIFAVCQGHRKLLMLLDEGLILHHLTDQARAAMQGAILAADHLIPASQGLLDTLASQNPTLQTIPATVIPPPIDPPAAERSCPFGERPGTDLPRVVTVARLSAEKQIDACLRTHRLLRDQGLDFHWHVIGEGSERSHLEHEIRELGMADRFHLEGFQEDPRAWMRHADLFVLASRSEGCPTVVREAIAEGTPVLATDVNGVRELIRDGITGVVVCNCGPALRTALQAILGDPVFLGRLRNNLSGEFRAKSGGESERLAACLHLAARKRPWPKVTILIPTYNQEPFIDRAIHSALMQDFEALEVVVCDDASTDATERITCRHRNDPRFRCVRRSVNLGRVANYRLAVEHDARGEWVLMLDGDDHLTDPTFISKALRQLAEHQDQQPLFVQAGHRVVWQKGADPLRQTRPHVDILPAIPAESSVMSGGEYLSFVYETGFFTHLGTIYSRRAALQQGIYTNDISSSDMDSLLRLALRGKVIVMKTIAGAWVQNGNNTSSSLPLERIQENVCIFRQIAREGEAAGVIDMACLEKQLTRYEALTLIHLFSSAIGKSVYGPWHALQMILIALSINPRVLLVPEMTAAWRYYARAITIISLQRLKARLSPAVSFLCRRSA